jgi:hypothetical protein
MVMVKNGHFDHDHNTILSSNSHGQMVKIKRYFNNFNKFQQFQQQKIWNCRNRHDKIFIDDFDHRNFGILRMTIEAQFWPSGQKIVVIKSCPFVSNLLCTYNPLKKNLSYTRVK